MAKSLLSKGHQVNVKIRHRDRLLCDKYHVDITKLGKVGYLIVDELGVIIEASKVYDVNFLNSITNSLSFQDTIEKK